MKTFLKIIFSCFLIAIAYFTLIASLDRNVLEAGNGLWPDAWFKATLVDTYCAFLTVYCWMFYKEHSWFARVLWLVLVLTLGTFAYASYILIELFRLKENEPVQNILLRRPQKC
ncbi:MAG: DUF1475 family protein [Candidatus Omnitrophica bacterium]|nr:DUF1475 family protein [Candidatus Omnitrophota bacterium]